MSAFSQDPFSQPSFSQERISREPFRLSSPPAIIRPADSRILKSGYWPAGPAERQEALREMVRTGRLTKEAARHAIVWFAPAFFATQNILLAYVGAYGATASNNPLTFTGVSYGAGPGYLVFFFGCYTSGTSRTINSATVSGSAATLLMASPNGETPCAIFGIATTGGSGTVSVTGSSTLLNGGIDVWLLTGALSNTPTAIQQTTGSNPTVSITPSAGGVVLAGAAASASASVNWTNLTERADRTIGSSNAATVSSADGSGLAAAAISINATFTSNNTTRLLAAAFR